MSVSDTKSKYTTELEPITKVDPQDENTPDSHVLRDPSMIRLTGKHPFNAEPPLKALEKAGFVTPNQLHFVRNHGPVPQLSWDDHRVEITGLVNKPVVLSMRDILSLKATTIPVTMVCAGNRRKEQNMVKRSIGFAWGAAGCSTACWTGVLLCDVINHFAGGLKDGVNYMRFEGCDNTSKGAYGTSIAANRVMSDNYDILLAYKMNGELLPLDHGYPVRIIIPGCIGGRSVKWLVRVEASETESTNTYHYHDNKVLPPVVHSAQQAIAEDWWMRHDYALYDLNINSVITTPSHGERIEPQNIHDSYLVRGYAYTGSNRRITRVEVSLDGGKTWRLASPERPPPQEVASTYGELVGPSYYKRTRNWAWVLWNLEMDVTTLVHADEIAVRAWDDSQNTQPENLTWNLMGMLSNSWFRVKLRRENASDPVIRCEHPAIVGPMAGTGWMERAQQATAIAEAPSTLMKLETLPVVTMADVEAHTSASDCWIVVKELVYDCTSFLKEHPGGPSSILITAGTDTTEEFDAIHSSKAHDMLEDYLIARLPHEDKSSSSVISGNLVQSQEAPPSDAMMFNESFLRPKQWKTLTLERKVILSSNIRLFRFSFGATNFGLPVGQHVYFKLPQEQLSRDMKVRSIMRAYTPSKSGSGFVEFIVKIYYPEHGRPGGAFTQALDKVRVGETIEAKGPLGEYEYLGDLRYSIMRQPPKQASHIGMIAAGTGITPMWQVLDALRRDVEPPYVSLIYCARYIEDLVLSDEIDKLVRSPIGARLQVRYILSKPPSEGWKQGRGRLHVSDIKMHLFPFANSQTPDANKLVLLCGSEKMVDDCFKPLVAKVMGEEFLCNNVFVF